MQLSINLHSNELKIDSLSEIMPFHEKRSEIRSGLDEKMSILESILKGNFSKLCCFKIYSYLGLLKIFLMKIRSSILLPAALILMTLLGSCVRDYTCQCIIKYTGQPGLPDSVIKEYKIKDTKDNAKSLCEGNSGTFTTNGITTTENCKIY